MLYNQNNFSNKRNSFIPQINSDLATPATSNPDLKSSIHSTHNNSKTLELFNKSLVVDFTNDEILTELGNESEIRNGSMLLFPPIDKQEVFPSHSNVHFKSSSLICHKKEQEQRTEEICTTKDLSEGFKEFKSVRLISPKNRRLPRFSNDRASHINKTGKSNNNNKMPALHNHSSSETTVEQKIDVPDNSSGANFRNPLMSVKMLIILMHVLGLRTRF